MGRISPKLEKGLEALRSIGKQAMKIEAKSMSYLTSFYTVLLIVLSTQAYAGDRYMVSNGILVVDAKALRAEGIDIMDEQGQPLEGVIAVRAGLSIIDSNNQSRRIGGSSNDLSVFDTNKDWRIDESDASWEAMYLSVDYNSDGVVGEGEYALIGNCGIDAIRLDADNDKAWSLHKDGKTKVVKVPSL